MRNTLIFFLISLLIIGCKDETTTTSTIHDPPKPVQITGFEPTEGGARTRLYIQGNNFGSNTDDIKVICAVNILLENKRKAKKKLEEMSDGDREMFMTYPIYNLL